MTSAARSLSPSISLVIAQLITDYLGDNYPRGGPVGATLNALRTRLREGPHRYNKNRDLLSWEVRESIRTEFFKIRWPTPPSRQLLNLVTQTDILLTKYTAPTRPFYFPGARLAVPSPDPKRRMSATVLQLKYHIKPGQTANEALVHLDGPNGGGFQWVATPNCMLLEKYAAPYAYPQPMSRKQLSAAQMRKYARPAPKIEKVEVPPPVKVVEVKKQQDVVPDYREIKRKREIGDRARSPPPRVRLRKDVKGPMLMSSGALYDDDTDDEEIVVRGDDESDQMEWRRKRFKHSDNFEIISKIVARRKNRLRGPLTLGGVVEYLVEWSGYPDDAKLSWESRTALLKDVPGLVLEFDARYPGKPAEVSIPVDRSILADAYEKSDIQTDRSTVIGKRRKLGPGERPPPIPSYIEDPLLELSFSGMVLRLRPTEWNLFSTTDSALRDAEARKRRYKSEYPSFADYMFAPTVGDIADKEIARVKERQFLENQRNSVRKKLYRWPRILGGVLSRDIAHPTSTSCIEKAPASWDSYFLELGLSCDDWERQFVPHMPTAPELVQNSINEANDQLLLNFRRRYSMPIGDATGEPLNASVQISEAVEDEERANGVRPETTREFLAEESGVVNGTHSPRERALMFSKLNPDYSRALEKSKTVKDGGTQRYYDPVWCCWRKRPVVNSEE